MGLELEFRIWDNEEKKFFKPTYAAYKHELLDLSISLSGELLRRTLEQPCEHESCFKGRYSIQQFIGFSDKNGIKLYVEDIVKYFNRIGVIRYSKHQPQFILFSDNLEFPIDKFLLRDLVIIGNTRQNPKLLKK